MLIREHEPLHRHTTFRTGGPARYFIEASSLEEVQEAVAFGKERSLPLLVLGGGSNVLIDDKGFSGVVLRAAFLGKKYVEKGDSVEVTVGAGEVWDDLVSFCVERGWWGLENLSYIPGNVGAAPIQNIGAYGAQASDVVYEVKVFDSEQETVRMMTKEECAFGYRSSFFKGDRGKKYIVLEVSFLLSTKEAPNLSYTDVAQYFGGMRTPTLAHIREAIIAIRRKKLPEVSEVGTAGSFFKNPVITKSLYEALTERFPGMRGVESRDGSVKLSAAWLIEHIGKYKGVQHGGAKVSSEHALVIVNEGGAISDDIKTLASLIQKKIFDETKIILEPEVVFIE